MLAASPATVAANVTHSSRVGLVIVTTVKPKVNRENAVFHLYAGLNHMMMPTQGRRDLSEYAVKNTVSEEVIADIADFVLH